MAQQLIKKITARDVMGDMKKFMREQGAGKSDGDEIPLFTIIGQVIGHQTGNSSYGDWIKLKGRFRATNKVTNEVYNSSVAMLPDECVDPILAALTLDDVASVDMAFDISSKIDDSTAVGYVYVVKPLMEPSEDDPLERLASQVSGSPQIEDKSKAGGKAAAK